MTLQSLIKYSKLLMMSQVFFNQTTLHPLGLAAIVILGCAMLLLPRRLALLPMIVMACFIAPAQRLVIFTLDFDLLRLMILFGWLRVLLKDEVRGMIWKPIDTAILAWGICGTIAYTILYGTFAAIINRLGWMFDAVGMYFLFRWLIRDWSDLNWLIRGFIVVSLPVAAAFVVERMTSQNVFAIFGGVPAITLIREGRLRCQGAFAHPILAGCFWAALMPLFAAQWWIARKGKVWAMVGLFTSSVIVVTCSSSTPVAAVLFGILGACLFPLRSQMRLVRWGVVCTILGLHIVMKAPVWHLISRVDLVGGSTGWHRYHLIDQAINHVGEWCLIGTRSTAHWGGGLADVTNQYVLQAVQGGALKLCLFLAIIALAFGGIGQRRQMVEGQPERLVLIWAIGLSLFVHCMVFFAVSYFGQIHMLWYLTLAIAANVTPITKGRRAITTKGQTWQSIVRPRARPATATARSSQPLADPITIHSSVDG